MSRQSDAKAAQGYVAGQPKVCGACKWLGITRVLPEWESKRNRESAAAGLAPRYTIEACGQDVKPRCTLGDFAVKKMATCDQFAPKP